MSPVRSRLRSATVTYGNGDLGRQNPLLDLAEDEVGVVWQRNICILTCGLGVKLTDRLYPATKWFGDQINDTHTTLVFD